jgi:hypothetical protein
MSNVDVELEIFAFWLGWRFRYWCMALLPISVIIVRLVVIDVTMTSVFILQPKSKMQNTELLNLGT